MRLLPDDIAAIRRLPFFADMADDSREALLAEARVAELGPGSILWRPEQPVEKLHLLLDGYVAVLSHDEHANDYVIEFIGAGVPFVLPTVVLDKPYLSSGQILRPSRVVTFPAALLRECAERDQRLLMVITRTVCDRGRGLADHIKLLKTRNGAQRLAAFLLSLVQPEAGWAGATLELPCERRLLAGWLGIVPGSVSRTFRQLEEVGVAGGGRRLTVESLDRLRTFAGLAAA